MLAAEHRHFDIERLRMTLVLTLEGTELRWPLRAKTIASGARVLRIKAEHDDLAAICAHLREQGRALPLAVLKAAVETRLRGGMDGGELHVRL